MSTQEKQFVNIDKALKQLVTKFQGCQKDNKPFWVSKYDILCLNNVVDYVERDRRAKPWQHSLLSKLIIFLYWQLMIKYNAHVDDKAIQNTLGRILERPLDMHISEFVQFVNGHEKVLFIDVIKQGNHFDDSSEIVKQMTPEQHKALVTDFWDFERGKYFLAELITNCINNFSNDSKG